ncbi:MAG TPA: hypothetical protein VEU55_10795 [Gemmatimonadales bacterium]|nr:hypothetical protein [Gemmatimonadales bacterium]
MQQTEPTLGAADNTAVRNGWPPFRAFISPPRAGADNMALDLSLLAEAARGGQALLRLYRFDPPCLSFGRHEPAQARYDRAAIVRLGIDVVRRPTGGRAVWHEHEVTYAVAAPVALWGSLGDGYRAIHERLAAAVRALGAPATLAPARTHIRPLTGGACFASAVGGEVLVAGRKLIGSAQLREGSAFLQHGSVLLAGSQEIVARLSRAPAPGQRDTTLFAALGRPVGFEEAAAAIVAAFGCASAAERPPARTPPMHLARFRDAAWTWRR